MKHGLVSVLKCTLAAVAMVACGASRAGATLISADLGAPGQTGPDVLISMMSFEGGEAGLYLASSGLHLDIVRFGDGQGASNSNSLTGGNSSVWIASFGAGNPYFPFGFQGSGPSGGSQSSSLGGGLSPSSSGLSSSGQTSTAVLTANPEPSTMILLGTGLAALIRRRMRQRAADNKTEARSEER
jgi:hypothetical protein